MRHSKIKNKVRRKLQRQTGSQRDRQHKAMDKKEKPVKLVYINQTTNNMVITGDGANKEKYESNNDYMLVHRGTLEEALDIVNKYWKEKNK